jgi:DmsE family decaheme c-type cytochrome
MIDPRVNRRALILLLTCVAGCSSLKKSQPILEMQELEAMTAGRLEAEYVGTNACLQACHYHDELRRHWDASTMGVAMDTTADMPAVDCESCHGPGSLAIANLTDEKVREDTAKGMQTACNYDTFIDIKNLPAPAQSLICLRCHTAESSFNLHAWASSAHAAGDVSCTGCHDIHAGPDLVTPYAERSRLCTSCHGRAVAQFSLPSAHPLRENKVTCTDCHDPHGANVAGLLRETTAETCAACHPEVVAPFAFAHADVMEECSTCHAAHGSMHDNLLAVNEPYLCMRCHASHPVRTASGPSGIEAKSTFFTRCSDCHAAVHGSDVPAPSGRGTFLR